MSQIPASGRWDRRVAGIRNGKNYSTTSMPATSPEKLIRNLLPLHHLLFGLLRREEPDAEIAFRRLERRHQGSNVGMGRDVVGVAENLLAFLRHDEIDQE